MRKKFVFATNNSHKLEEVTAILGEKVELLSMKDIKCDTDIPVCSYYQLLNIEKPTAFCRIIIYILQNTVVQT